MRHIPRDMYLTGTRRHKILMGREAATTSLRTAQIGRCGELLVQYLLLKDGIESAALTTDSGIDLVAYAPRCQAPVTIQVKSNLQPKPAGGKGQPTLDWWISKTCPAQLIALADLSTQKVWLLSASELNSKAQQDANDRWHIYMHTAPQSRRGVVSTNHVSRFDEYLIENRALAVFGSRSKLSLTAQSPLVTAVEQA
jgi:hypothetical protein